MDGTTQQPERRIPDLEYEQIQFTVLGGIRLDGLDRMRVTLKLDFKGQAIRHNLDLYNDTQTEKLMKKTAERLSIGTSYIAKAIAELTNQLESYRLTEIENRPVPGRKRKSSSKKKKKKL